MLKLHAFHYRSGIDPYTVLKSKKEIRAARYGKRQRDMRYDYLERHASAICAACPKIPKKCFLRCLLASKNSKNSVDLR